MRKLITLAIVLMVFLQSGCVIQRESRIIETDNINYEELYEQHFSMVKYVPPEDNSGIKDFCADLGDSEKIHVEVDTFLPVELDEMISDSRTNFIYGEVYKVEEYNCFSYSVYFKVFETGFTSDERQLVRISVIHGDVLEEGKTYILNLTYSEEPDFYSLSQSHYSIFFEDASGNITREITIDDGTYNLDEFLEEIFGR